MDLLKRIEEFKELDEKARKAEVKLTEMLRKQFVDLPFEVQKVEIKEVDIWDKQIVKNIYYPVLLIPEGYKKEQEEYTKEYANCVYHNYLLKNENGTEIKVSEHAVFSNCLVDRIEGRIDFPFSIILESVTYNIKIHDVEYKFIREYPVGNFLQSISKRRIGKAKYSSIVDKSYSMADKEYKVFLAALGITKKETSLSEIVNSGQKEIILNEQLKAKVSIARRSMFSGTRFRNKYWNVYIKDVPYEIMEVSMEIYSVSGRRIFGANFRWKEFKKIKDKPNYKNGITLQEAIGIIG